MELLTITLSGENGKVYKTWQLTGTSTAPVFEAALEMLSVDDPLARMLDENLDHVTFQRGEI